MGRKLEFDYRIGDTCIAAVSPYTVEVAARVPGFEMASKWARAEALAMVTSKTIEIAARYGFALLFPTAKTWVRECEDGFELGASCETVEVRS